MAAEPTTQHNELTALPENCPPLGTYYFYLTQGCNLACQHCWLAPQYQPHGGTGGHLSLDVLKGAIEEGIPLGLNNVKLTGGEPTLHPDFAEFVEYLNAQDLGITVETNATLITKDLARVIARGVSHISVSLDGATVETHEALRGVKGSYETATRGIHNLVEAGVRPQIIMSIHAGNADEIEDLVYLAKNLGASSVKFNLIQSTGRGKNMTAKGRLLDIQGLIELGKWVENELQEQARIPLLYSWPIAFWSMRRLSTFYRYSCAIHHILGILPTGHMALCGIGTTVPDMIFGQLGVDRVADVWASHPTLHEIREKIPNELDGVCSECLFRSYCKGVCVAHNYVSGGSITSPSWFCATADQHGLFPEGKRTVPRT